MRLLLLQPETQFSPPLPAELLSRGLAGNVQPRRLLISAVSGFFNRLGPNLKPALLFFNQVHEVLPCDFLYFSSLLFLIRVELIPVFDKLRDQKERSQCGMNYKSRTHRRSRCVTDLSAEN